MFPLSRYEKKHKLLKHNRQEEYLIKRRVPSFVLNQIAEQANAPPPFESQRCILNHRLIIYVCVLGRLNKLVKQHNAKQDK